MQKPNLERNHKDSWRGTDTFFQIKNNGIGDFTMVDFMVLKGNFSYSFYFQYYYFQILSRDIEN